jgi:hypothetical protein
MEMVDGKGAPVGVKIISVLYYIGAALGLISGLFFIFGGAAFGSLIEQNPVIGVLGSSLFIVIGIVSLGFAVLDFFIAKGLWRGKNWARIVVIILAILGVLGSLSSLINSPLSGIVGILVSGAVGGYLLFSKEVKAFFR